ncbi:MAG: hypothetical protein F6J93_29645 [Oscillatoria sp. SIO1A7]|nr:hypothetical protein [Oscillatoria sp. SIO1A7]
MNGVKQGRNDWYSWVERSETQPTIFLPDNPLHLRDRSLNRDSHIGMLRPSQQESSSGDRSSQSEDIRVAKEYWNDYCYIYNSTYALALYLVGVNGR